MKTLFHAMVKAGLIDPERAKRLENIQHAEELRLKHESQKKEIRQAS